MGISHYLDITGTIDGELSRWGRNLLPGLIVERRVIYHAQDDTHTFQADVIYPPYKSLMWRFEFCIEDLETPADALDHMREAYETAREKMGLFMEDRSEDLSLDVSRKNCDGVSQKTREVYHG